MINIFYLTILKFSFEIICSIFLIGEGNFIRSTKITTIDSTTKNKIISILLILVIAIILVDRINFPSPTKKIEKIIPNEKFKIVK